MPANTPADSRLLDPDTFGTTVFIKRGDALGTSEGSTATPVNWRNVVIVDQDGGGDFTTIQAAIDSITTASVAEVFTVYVMGGNYVEATITMKSFVFVRGIIGGGDSTGVLISVTNSASGAIIEADDSGFQDIVISASSSGVNWTLDVDTARIHFSMHHTRVLGRSRLGAGVYMSCHFTGTVDLNGSGVLSLPTLNNCHIVITGGGSLSSGVTDHGHIVGGAVWATPNITNSNISLGPQVVCTGVDFVLDRDGLSTRDWNYSCRGLFSGCSFSHYDPAPTNATEIDPTEGTYVGCMFNGISVHATPSNGPIAFAGSSWDMSGLTNGGPCLNIAANTHPVILSGSVLRQAEATDSLIETSVTNAILELNGNTYRGTIPAATVANLRLRGTDVRSEFFPVNTMNGTGAVVEKGVHPVMELNVAAETAYVMARLAPPADVARILDARLVVSGEFDKAEDTFTNTTGTALASHTSDTGEAWTLVAGTATIEGNRTTGTAAGIHTWGAAGDTGFLQALINHAGIANLKLGLLFRYSDVNNYWRVEIKERSTSANIDLRLVKRVAGVETTVASTHVGGASFNGTVGVSFFGDDIKVFCDTGLEDNGLVFEVTDAFNNTATVVGLYFGGSSSTHYFDDLAFWRGDTTLDLTVDTDYGQEASPLDELTDSLTLANQAIAHRVFSYIDIRDALTGVKQGSIIGLKVTLDALGTVNTALHVHGVLLRTLPASIPLRATQVATDGTESQQITYR
ncbi:hypothetical protein LCGC14_0423330 [marine sediment metagenome]|uniref:Pectinesterase catalytic domain-containing protein n=1 Tax=marine sediment metagenome TaxID=412755 RepID=A0A0F9SQ53_9ZZZZ